MDGECPDTVNPEPVAAEPADRHPGSVRGHRGHLPAPGPRPVEHDAGRGRHRCHRHRPGDLRRSGRGRTGAVPRAPRRPTGDRGDLSPTPTSTTSVACSASSTPTPTCRSSRRQASWSTRSRRTSTPAPRCCVAACTTPGAACRSAATGTVGVGLGAGASEGTVGLLRAHAGHHPHRPGGDPRRCPHRLPDDPRHRGAGGDELPLPRPAARCAWPRTPPTTCTTS